MRSSSERHPLDSPCGVSHDQRPLPSTEPLEADGACLSRLPPCLTGYSIADTSTLHKDKETHRWRSECPLTSWHSSSSSMLSTTFRLRAITRCMPSLGVVASSLGRRAVRFT